jgi:hypothetical protein
MTFNSPPPLTIYNVEDRGIPNRERIPIYVQKSTALTNYGIIIGQIQGDRGIVPYRDNLFWFGEAFVNAGDWILLYTGSGKFREDPLNNSIHNKVYSIHWGKPQTVFAASNVTAAIFQFNSVCIAPTPTNAPQPNYLENK